MKSTRVPPVLVGLLVVLFASGFIFLGVRGLHQDYQFNENVGRSTAMIERLDSTSSGKGGTKYEAIVSFVAGKESVSEDRIRVAPGTFYRLHQGDQVPIKYLSDQPGQARIEEKGDDDWHWQNDEAGLGVGLLFASFGLIIAWFGRPRETTR
jgi:Protein of unknown function (DUF3592)